jgi:topoisomerase-4 subunit B
LYERHERDVAVVVEPADEMRPAVTAYDESKVRTLSSVEHIRLRTGMYIGRLGDGSHPDDGIYVLFKEVIDNSVDEYIMGFGRRIAIECDGVSCKVRDWGRGIPLGKLEECVSVINTGAKYNTDVFQFSVGLNGVGAKAVNALSERFRVLSCRDGQFRELTFSRGCLVDEKAGSTGETNGTRIEFTPDSQIFPGYVFRPEFLAHRARHYAYLNTGLRLVLNGESFLSSEGLRDLLADEAGEAVLYPAFYYRENTLEFAFTHTNDFGERYLSFANGQHTSAGGTHLSAFKEGVLKGINSYAGKSFSPDDIREGMIGVVAIRLQDPVFESQTKTRLGNTDIRSSLVNRVKQEVEQQLHRNPSAAEALLAKIQVNLSIRTELQNVRKKARERAKKIAIRIPSLRDCRIHLGDEDPGREETTIFLTEGQSASGSIVACRDVMTQAIFSLRGKPMNSYGLRRDTLYNNEEWYNIMQALNIEGGIEGLRYNRIVLATDADVDGMHIRNLLLTFFLHFFEGLVLDNHLFILETPLFRVRTKKETVYCYSARERDSAVDRLGKAAEITRFKGLGEISPGEFGQFIGSRMKLIPVSINRHKEVPQMLEFFMGRNTPERRLFIMDNLR